MENDLSSFSVDDLKYEVKRLQLRCSVLERDKAIWQEEMDIKNTAISSNMPLVMLQEELNCRGDELRKYRKNYTLLANKMMAVQRHFELEKNALAGIRQETITGLTLIEKEFRGKFGSLKKCLSNQAKSLEEAGLLKEELDQNLNTITTLQKILSTLESVHASEKKYLQNELISKNLEIDGISLQISQKEDNVQKLQLQNLELQNKIQLFEAQTNENNLQLSSKISNIYAELKSKENENICLISTNLDLNKQLKNYEKLQQEYQNSETKISEELTQMSIKYNQSQETKQNLEKEIQSKNQLLERLQSQTLQETQLLQFNIHQLNTQIKQLENTNINTQNELNAALIREDNLKLSIGKSGSDNYEIQSKLTQIQEKLRRIENDNDSELSRLKNTLIDQERRYLEAGNERDKWIASNHLMESRCRELTNSIDIVNKKLHESTETVNNLQKIIIKLESEKQAAKRTTCSLELTCEQLRNDRDECQARVSQLTKELTQNEVLRNRQLEEIKVLKLDKEETLKSLNGRIDSAALEKRVQELELSLDQKESEVFHLKSVVQRECEERTEMMIELSELKDRLKRLQISGKENHDFNQDVTIQPSKKRTPQLPTTSATSSVQHNTGMFKGSSARVVPAADYDSNGSEETGLSATTDEDVQWAKQITRHNNGGKNNRSKRSK